MKLKGNGGKHFSTECRNFFFIYISSFPSMRSRKHDQSSTWIDNDGNSRQLVQPLRLPRHLQLESRERQSWYFVLSLIKKTFQLFPSLSLIHNRSKTSIVNVWRCQHSTKQDRFLLRRLECDINFLVLMGLDGILGEWWLAPISGKKSKVSLICRWIY